MIPLYPWNMPVARGLGNGTSRPFVNPSNVDVRPARLQRRPPAVRRDATGHRRCDNAVAQGQRRDTQQQPDHVPCGCCQTAPCRPASSPKAQVRRGPKRQFQILKKLPFPLVFCRASLSPPPPTSAAHEERWEGLESPPSRFSPPPPPPPIRPPLSRMPPGNVSLPPLSSFPSSFFSPIARPQISPPLFPPFSPWFLLPPLFAPHRKPLPRPLPHHRFTTPVS